MSRGFGSTYGTTSTDNIAPANLAWPATKYSIAAWVYVTSGSTVAVSTRLFDFNNGSCLIPYIPNTTTLSFQQNWSTTNGSWKVTAELRGAWHHIGVTYDGSSTSNVPVFYLDGTKPAITTNTTPVGTYVGGTQAFIIGNNASAAGIRVWDGMIAFFGMWNNVILSDGEMLSLAAGCNPLLVSPQYLLTYLPLDGTSKPEFDLVRTWPNSITGALLGKSDPPVQPLSRIRSLYDYQNDKIAAAGQILPFPWMQTSGGMRDLTGGFRN